MEADDGCARDIERTLRELAEAGEVQLPRERKDGWTWAPEGAKLEPETVSRLIENLREDRVGN